MYILVLPRETNIVVFFLHENPKHWQLEKWRVNLAT